MYICICCVVGEICSYIVDNLLRFGKKNRSVCAIRSTIFSSFGKPNHSISYQSENNLSLAPQRELIEAATVQ